jgi:membrane-associated phospholipid phosphatase
MRPVKSHFIYFAILLAVLPAVNRMDVYAQQDTIKNSCKHIAPLPSSCLLKNDWIKKGISPALLLTAGALTWSDRKAVMETRNRYIPDFSNPLDNYLQYVPAAGVFALSLAGKKGLNHWHREAINWSAGMLIMSTIVNSLKYSTKILRPDGTSYNSFPSGHTATAFMNATFLHKEYGYKEPAYSIAGYTISSFTGAERSLNNRHWVSDILAGAGIGILSTELAYLIVDRFYKDKGDFFSDFIIHEEIDRPSFFAAGMAYSYCFGDGEVPFSGIESTFEGAWYFNKQWGIGGQIVFFHFPFKDENLGDDNFYYKNMLIQRSLLDRQSMGMLSLLVRPQYTKTLGSKFLLQISIGAGITIGANGNININGTFASEENTSSSENIPLVSYQPLTAFICGTGFSLTCMMSPRIGISLFTDYKYSKPTFKYTIAKELNKLPVNEDDLTDRITINNLSTGLRLTAFF